MIVSSALLGLLLGLPSRRLIGDYLAIVTLFFAQIFVVMATNADRITLPWNDGPTDFTGGPNGITDVDPISIFGYEFDSIRSYLWLSLGVFTLVVVALQLVNHSRTGRAWRALREDPLAAELMTMPVNRLKLLAFMFGAATAGLTGTLFAAVQLNVFPQNFELPLLITVYAMVILGGAGSIPGVVIGAIVINVSLELLRDPENARAALLRRDRARAARADPALAEARRRLRRHDRVRDRRLPARRVAAARVGVRHDRGRLGAGLLDGWVIHPVDGTHLGNVGLRAPDRRGDHALGAARSLAHDPPRPDALPRRVRLGGAARHRAERDPDPPARRAPDRADELAPAGAARHVAGGDRLMAKLLELKGISKAFGGLQVIDGLDLHVDEGEIVSVIGPNGAGKTTLFNLITGVYSPDHGEILLDGRSLVGLPPHQITRLGVRAHVPDAAALSEHDGEGERDGRGVRPHAAPA